jgi:16S rRNA (guanine527-N7)-methyltransferase
MQIDRNSFESVFNVSRETIERLGRYEALLLKWNKKINLVSKATVAQIWHRHFADSAQLWSISPADCKVWLDFGSGAGFPGLVCAILAKDCNSSLKIILVESDQRKAAFLMVVARELGLNVDVVSDRIEQIAEVRADVISARAVAALPDLLDYAAPHRQQSTVLLFPKGNSYESELTTAQKYWHMDVNIIKSLTDSGSVILKIKDIKRAT